MKTHSWRSVRSVVRNARPKTRRPPIVGHRIPVSVWHILRDLTMVIVDGGRDAPVAARLVWWFVVHLFVLWWSSAILVLTRHQHPPDSTKHEIYIPDIRLSAHWAVSLVVRSVVRSVTEDHYVRPSSST